MGMTWWQIALSGLAGLVGGAVNSLAGGGTLISFPALTALGLPPVTANTTNTVALVPGYLSGALAQRDDVRSQRSTVRVVMPVAIVGGLLGGFLLLHTDASTFELLVPWLTLAATALLAVESPLKARIKQRRVRRPDTGPGARSHTAVIAFWAFVGAVYGGFFGAGLGIVMLALLGLVLTEPLTKVNAVKQVVSLGANGAAALFFVGSGEVAWGAALALGIGSFAGGAVGGRFASRVRPAVLRSVVVVLGLAVSIAFFVHYY